MITIKQRDDIFTALRDHHAIVITPNNRLSNQLLHTFFNQDPAPVQEKPRLLPYPAFLSWLFKKNRDNHPEAMHPLLLNPHQTRLLWIQLLFEQEIPCNEGLLSQIQEAWSRCQHWDIDLHHPTFQEIPQTQQFQTWAHQFQTRLADLNAITSEQLATYLQNKPDLLEATPLIWISFDEFTPQQQILQSALADAGNPSLSFDLDHEPSLTQIYPATDHKDEDLQMIRWVQQKLTEKGTRIAVVVPDLQTQSKRLQRLFEQHIPRHQFNISLGQPLTHFPLVTHALEWLALGDDTISHQTIQLLLCSPFLSGSKNEFTARAQLLQQSPLLQRHTLALTMMIQTTMPTSPRLATLLQTISLYPSKASPSSWSDQFKTRLIAVGFPGDYPLSSSVYQCFQRFITLLDDLRALSMIQPLMSKQDALQALTDLAKATIFQIQTPETPVQVLGVLEASGCTFDSLWVTGLTDQCLPQRPQLSAFIPITLQRSKQMPHATALRELHRAELLLLRLRRGSNDTVFSYPKQTGDTPNLPCALIHHLPLFIPRHTVVPSRPSSLIVRDDHYTLPCKTPIKGTTTLLANQAKCPFRAFAAHRLNAEPSPKHVFGLQPSERGQLIHRVMEHIWRTLGTQQHLLQMAPDALQQLIQQQIHLALHPLAKNHDLHTLVQEVEMARLQQLALACLEWDKQRESFTIEALEQSFTCTVGDIDFKVRIDRLDIQADHTLSVIDYKSTLPSSIPWNDDRPEEPQLLFYALLHHNIRTLMFLELKAGRVACRGLSEAPSTISGVYAIKKDEQWSTRQATWQTQMTDLANEYREGHCPPQPTRPSTCLQCDFISLCRINK